MACCRARSLMHYMGNMCLATAVEYVPTKPRTIVERKDYLFLTRNSKTASLRIGQ